MSNKVLVKSKRGDCMVDVVKGSLFVNHVANIAIAQIMANKIGSELQEMAQHFSNKLKGNQRKTNWVPFS